MVETNQNCLFGRDKTEAISIDDAASQLSVSTASIRNWIKTGYLIQTRKSLISMESYQTFRREIAGSEKLVSRVNKSLKDEHDHLALGQDIENLLSNDSLSIDKLGCRYEESLSNAYKNKEGIYYTPEEIVEAFFRYLPKDKSKLKFCDPCCGSGNFLMAAIAAGFSPENVYGYDVDPIAIEIAKKRLLEKTGNTSGNIVCTDFLEAAATNKKKSFDVIFTNPPWGKKLDKLAKGKYASILGAGKSQDTTSLFFFAALSLLNKNGYIGFLVQDAFFNVATYEDARKKALAVDVKALLDFGKPFRGLLTKARGIIVKNSKPVGGSLVECVCTATGHRRLQNSFSQNPRSILNMNGSPEEADVITHLYSIPHVSLAGRVKWGLGIVTGNNKRFVVDQPLEGYMPVYKGADIQKGGIKDPSSFLPANLSLYQQVAPQELYEAGEKLIYKFISSNLVFFLDTEQRYVLNSANMIIPDNNFPISTQQLSQLLNSRVINWLFRTVFDTHKVLRSDLEALPVYIDYFKDNPVFDEQSFNDYLGLEESENRSFRIKGRPLIKAL